MNQRSLLAMRSYCRQINRGLPLVGPDRLAFLLCLLELAELGSVPGELVELLPELPRLVEKVARRSEG
jgi:hypothetical protein